MSTSRSAGTAPNRPMYNEANWWCFSSCTGIWTWIDDPLFGNGNFPAKAKKLQRRCSMSFPMPACLRVGGAMARRSAVEQAGGFRTLLRTSERKAVCRTVSYYRLREAAAGCYRQCNLTSKPDDILLGEEAIHPITASWQTDRYHTQVESGGGLSGTTTRTARKGSWLPSPQRGKVMVTCVNVSLRQLHGLLIIATELPIR